MARKFEDLGLADLEERIAEAQRRENALLNEKLGIEGKIAPLKTLLSGVQSNLQSCQSQIAAMRDELAWRKMPKATPTVTDHALLRYIERVHEIDMDKLRATILTDSVRKAIKGGASSLKQDGLIFYITNNAITTISLTKLPEKDKQKPLTRAQRERLEDEDCGWTADSELDVFN